VKAVIAYLRQKRWSPYAAGVLLGLTSTAAIGFSKQLLGASGAFENLVGLIEKSISPSLTDNFYFNYIMPPGVSWQVFLSLGVILGAFVSAILSGDFRWRMLPDRQWREVFGPSVAKRWLLVFFSAILLEYGAGIAGGCTSGLAISGGITLAPSAFIFVGAAFATGIPLALFLYRGKKV
jgi:uncharacterized protein